jgi:hypothetical protein
VFGDGGGTGDAPVRIGPFVTTAEPITLDVRLPAWGELPLQLVDPEGRPVRRVQVTAMRDPMLIGSSSAGRPDAQGLVVLRSCVPGSHQVHVFDLDGDRHTQRIDVQPGRNPLRVVQLPAGVGEPVAR